jgi:hypothetical protein
MQWQVLEIPGILTAATTNHRAAIGSKLSTISPVCFVNYLPVLDLIRLPVFIRFGSGSDHDLGANHATNRRSNSSGAALIAPQ